MSDILSANQLEIRPGAHVLFNNLSLDFFPNQITAIVGENGVGKSSLLNCLSGIRPAWHGTVMLGDTNLWSLSNRQRACLVSFIGQTEQTPDDLRVEARIAQGLAARLGFHVLLDKLTFVRVEKICEELSISHLIGRSFKNLSGGEKKRVHIARALINDQAQVYILDEPDAGLDLRHRHTLMSMLKRRSMLGKIIIVTLHDLTLSQSSADRTIVLAKGLVVADGPSMSLLTQEITQKQFGTSLTYLPL
jgi:iron complex transport system ATP-binding protein